MRRLMFKRIRRMRISLAAKCQILFGAAVLLIIAAALFVPVQRMEQLMDQMNERTAMTLAEWAEADHVAKRLEHRAAVTTRPATPPPVPTTVPAAVGGAGPVKVSVNILFRNAEPWRLSRFDQRAMEK